VYSELAGVREGQEREVGLDDVVNPWNSGLSMLAGIIYYNLHKEFL